MRQLNSCKMIRARIPSPTSQLKYKPLSKRTKAWNPPPAPVRCFPREPWDPGSETCWRSRNSNQNRQWTTQFPFLWPTRKSKSVFRKNLYLHYPCQWVRSSKHSTTCASNSIIRWLTNRICSRLISQTSTTHNTLASSWLTTR